MFLFTHLRKLEIKYKVVMEVLLSTWIAILREAIKKKSRENNENGILGRGVSDLIHFFKTLHKSENGGVERQSLYFIKYQTRPFFTWISLLFGCIFVYMTDFYLN